MAIKNVKVSVTVEGTVTVETLKGVSIPNVEVTGLKEFAKAMMALGAEKQKELMITEYKKAAGSDVKPTQAASEASRKQTPAKNNKENKPVAPVKTDNNKTAMFSNIRRAGGRVVLAELKGKDYAVGFAKDRNAFVEQYDGVLKEVTRSTVINRLRKYQGADVQEMVNIINSLRPATMARATCSCCGAELNANVKEYSLRNYGVALCRTCQKDPNRKTDAAKQNADDKGAGESSAPICSMPTCGVVASHDSLTGPMCKAHMNETYVAAKDVATKYEDGFRCEDCGAHAGGHKIVRCDDKYVKEDVIAVKTVDGVDLCQSCYEDRKIDENYSVKERDARFKQEQAAAKKEFTGNEAHDVSLKDMGVEGVESTETFTCTDCKEELDGFFRNEGDVCDGCLVNQRKAESWTDKEIISGKRNEASDSEPKKDDSHPAETMEDSSEVRNENNKGVNLNELFDEGELQ